MSQLLLCLDLSVTVSDKNVNGSFWYNVYNFLGMDKFESIIGMFPKGMRKRQFIASILFCLVNHFEMVIQRSIAKQNKTETPNAYLGPKSYTEIQRLDGWAIYSRKVAVQKKRRAIYVRGKERQEHSVIDLRLSGLLQVEENYLELMSTCKDEIKGDTEYMSKYYPIVDQIYNKGGLTLVSKRFLKWARALVVEINLNINLENIWKRKNDVMKDAFTNITRNKHLFALFNEALPTMPAKNEKVVRRCYTEVTVKAMHARAGTIFKLFFERYIGHYSDKINVEFRKTLQVTEKNKLQKSKVKTEKENQEEA